MNNSDYEKIAQKYARLREEADADKNALLAELFLSHTRLGELEEELKSAYISQGRALVLHDNCAAAEYAELIAKLSDEKRHYMEKHNISDKVFLPAYKCEKCNDTGIVKGTSSKRCECFYRYATELYFSSAYSKACREYTFSAFDPYIFSDTPSGNSDKAPSVRTYMCRIRDALNEYCNDFPHNPQKNVLLTGGTGTGKTYLLYCIANELISKGTGVLFSRSFTMFNELFDAYISDNYTFNDMVSNLVNVDVLIIDDLGTELKKRNFTLNTLTSVLDERAAASRHTFISTNHSLSELQEEYTDRVFSRLANVKNTLCIRTIGDDLRIRT